MYILPFNIFRLAQLASTGYIPSSVYLRSSYRTKQYPTLSAAAAGSTNSANAAHVARQQHHPIQNHQQQQHHSHPHRPQSTSSSNLDMVDGAGRSATLPSSPFRNKYESHLTQCDSPVGLYNCPQQRTSQAFSSMDDLDAMVSAAGSMSSRRSSAAHMPPPPPMTASSHPKHQQQMQFPMVRLEAAAAATSGGGGNVYPSLERSIVRGNTKQPYKMANRELPALPTHQLHPLNSAPPRPPPVGIKPLKSAAELARSMEDLDVLEAAGIRGRSKMNYREVGAVNGGDSVSLADAMLNKLNMAAHRQQQHQTHPHHLRNNEEYPPHLSPAAATPIGSNHAGVASSSVPAAGAANPVGSHNMLGIRPLETGGPYPTPLTSATLLPGQTYPEPAVSTTSIASLQDVFYNHHAHAHHHRQVSALSAVVSSKTTTLASAAVPSGGGEEGAPPPPPLYPKQYHHVIEQRRRSGLGEPPNLSNGMPVPPRSIVSESPAVNRKVKPVMSTPPAPTTPTPASSSSSSAAAAPPLPPTPSSSVKRLQLDESFENVPPLASSLEDSPGKSQQSAAAKFVPYRESTKPFEMADFYKYSTKYRKASASSLKDGVEGSGHESASNDSKRSSTASGGSSGHHSAAGGQPLGLGPPEIPARANSSAPGQPPLKADLGEDFSSEMLAWYNKQKVVTPAGGSGSSSSTAPSDPNKPATLV